jgi:hypothetical protein
MTHQEAIEVAESCRRTSSEDPLLLPTRVYNLGVESVIEALRERNTSEGWAAAMKRKAER